MEASLVYPHQLYNNNKNLKGTVYLIEDELFFSQYNFHPRKITLHQKSMSQYGDTLKANGLKVEYISASEPESKTERLFDLLSSRNVTLIHYTDTTDYLLERRLSRYAKRKNIPLKKYESPNFICTNNDIAEYFNSGKRYLLASFYEAQRKRLNILMDGDQPIGGRWSFDAENRKKMPKNTVVPKPPDFKYLYPVNHLEADQALEYFLIERFQHYGVYQDAIVKKEHFLFHSVISSSVNIGLLDPADVVQKAIHYAAKNNIPFNSLEGFVRQIIGWREYIRAVYTREGVKQRTKNFMGFTRKIPQTFYTARTGIDPVDAVILKATNTAYAHHIERLMIMGNFMLLCEFDPNEVYRWFMEFFIDAYDWVMVPNVYGMSQFADGGLMSTKPYISSSNYILKMSDFKKGEWCEIWDALFWRWMHVHRDMLVRNPRLSMLLNTFDKMPATKQKKILHTAENYLDNLDQNNAGSLFSIL